MRNSIFFLEAGKSKGAISQEDIDALASNEDHISLLKSSGSKALQLLRDTVTRNPSDLEKDYAKRFVVKVFENIHKGIPASILDTALRLQTSNLFTSDDYLDSIAGDVMDKSEAIRGTNSSNRVYDDDFNNARPHRFENTPVLAKDDLVYYASDGTLKATKKSSGETFYAKDNKKTGDIDAYSEISKKDFYDRPLNKFFLDKGMDILDKSTWRVLTDDDDTKKLKKVLKTSGLYDSEASKFIKDFEDSAFKKTEEDVPFSLKSDALGRKMFRKIVPLDLDNENSKYLAGKLLGSSESNLDSLDSSILNSMNPTTYHNYLEDYEYDLIDQNFLDKKSFEDAHSLKTIDDSKLQFEPVKKVQTVIAKIKDDESKVKNKSLALDNAVSTFTKFQNGESLPKDEVIKSALTISSENMKAKDLKDKGIDSKALKLAVNNQFELGKPEYDQLSLDALKSLKVPKPEPKVNTGVKKADRKPNTEKAEPNTEKAEPKPSTKKVESPATKEKTVEDESQEAKKAKELADARELIDSYEKAPEFAASSRGKYNKLQDAVKAGEKLSKEDQEKLDKYAKIDKEVQAYKIANDIVTKAEDEIKGSTKHPLRNNFLNVSIEELSKPFDKTSFGQHLSRYNKLVDQEKIYKGKYSKQYPIPPEQEAKMAIVKARYPEYVKSLIDSGTVASAIPELAERDVPETSSTSSTSTPKKVTTSNTTNTAKKASDSTNADVYAKTKEQDAAKARNKAYEDKERGVYRDPLEEYGNFGIFDKENVREAAKTHISQMLSEPDSSLSAQIVDKFATLADSVKKAALTDGDVKKVRVMTDQSNKNPDIKKDAGFKAEVQELNKKIVNYNNIKNEFDKLYSKISRSYLGIPDLDSVLSGTQSWTDYASKMPPETLAFITGLAKKDTSSKDTEDDYQDDYKYLSNVDRRRIESLTSAPEFDAELEKLKSADTDSMTDARLEQHKARIKQVEKAKAEYDETMNRAREANKKFTNPNAQGDTTKIISRRKLEPHQLKDLMNSNTGDYITNISKGDEEARLRSKLVSYKPSEYAEKMKELGVKTYVDMKNKLDSIDHSKKIVDKQDSLTPAVTEVVDKVFDKFLKSKEARKQIISFLDRKHAGNKPEYLSKLNPNSASTFKLPLDDKIGFVNTYPKEALTASNYESEVGKAYRELIDPTRTDYDDIARYIKREFKVSKVDTLDFENQQKLLKHFLGDDAPINTKYMSDADHRLMTSYVNRSISAKGESSHPPSQEELQFLQDLEDGKIKAGVGEFKDYTDTSLNTKKHLINNKIIQHQNYLDKLSTNRDYLTSDEKKALKAIIIKNDLGIATEGELKILPKLKTLAGNAENKRLRMSNPDYYKKVDELAEVMQSVDPSLDSSAAEALAIQALGSENLAKKGQELDPNVRKAINNPKVQKQLADINAGINITPIISKEDQRAQSAEKIAKEKEVKEKEADSIFTRMLNFVRPSKKQVKLDEPKAPPNSWDTLPKPYDRLNVDKSTNRKEIDKKSKEIYQELKAKYASLPQNPALDKSLERIADAEAETEINGLDEKGEMKQFLDYVNTHGKDTTKIPKWDREKALKLANNYGKYLAQIQREKSEADREHGMIKRALEDVETKKASTQQAPVAKNKEDSVESEETQNTRAGKISSTSTTAASQKNSKNELEIPPDRNTYSMQDKEDMAQTFKVSRITGDLESYDEFLKLLDKANKTVDPVKQKEIRDQLEVLKDSMVSALVSKASNSEFKPKASNSEFKPKATSNDSSKSNASGNDTIAQETPPAEDKESDLMSRLKRRASNKNKVKEEPAKEEPAKEEPAKEEPEYSIDPEEGVDVEDESYEYDRNIPEGSYSGIKDKNLSRIIDVLKDYKINSSKNPEKYDEDTIAKFAELALKYLPQDKLKEINLSHHSLENIQSDYLEKVKADKETPKQSVEANKKGTEETVDLSNVPIEPVGEIPADDKETVSDEEDELPINVPSELIKNVLEEPADKNIEPLGELPDIKTDANIKNLQYKLLNAISNAGSYQKKLRDEEFIDILPEIVDPSTGKLKDEYLDHFKLDINPVNIEKQRLSKGEVVDVKNAYDVILKGLKSVKEYQNSTENQREKLKPSIFKALDLILPSDEYAPTENQAKRLSRNAGRHLSPKVIQIFKKNNLISDEQIQKFYADKNASKLKEAPKEKVQAPTAKGSYAQMLEDPTVDKNSEEFINLKNQVDKHMSNSIQNLLWSYNQTEDPKQRKKILELIDDEKANVENLINKGHVPSNSVRRLVEKPKNALDYLSSEYRRYFQPDVNSKGEPNERTSDRPYLMSDLKNVLDKHSNKEKLDSKDLDLLKYISGLDTDVNTKLKTRSLLKDLFNSNRKLPKDVLKDLPPEDEETTIPAKIEPVKLEEPIKTGSEGDSKKLDRDVLNFVKDTSDNEHDLKFTSDLKVLSKGDRDDLILSRVFQAYNDYKSATEPDQKIKLAGVLEDSRIKAKEFINRGHVPSSNLKTIMAIVDKLASFKNYSVDKNKYDSLIGIKTGDLKQTDIDNADKSNELPKDVLKDLPNTKDDPSVEVKSKEQKIEPVKLEQPPETGSTDDVGDLDVGDTLSNAPVRKYPGLNDEIAANDLDKVLHFQENPGKYKEEDLSVYARSLLGFLSKEDLEKYGVDVASLEKIVKPKDQDIKQVDLEEPSLDNVEDEKATEEVPDITVNDLSPEKEDSSQDDTEETGQVDDTNLDAADTKEDDFDPDELTLGTILPPEDEKQQVEEKPITFEEPNTDDTEDEDASKEAEPFDYAKDAEETLKRNEETLKLNKITSDVQSMSDKASKGENLNRAEIAYLTKIQDYELPKEVKNSIGSLLGTTKKSKNIEQVDLEEPKMYGPEREPKMYGPEREPKMYGPEREPKMYGPEREPKKEKSITFDDEENQKMYGPERESSRSDELEDEQSITFDDEETPEEKNIVTPNIRQRKPPTPDRLKGDSSHRLNVAYNPQRKDLLRMHALADNGEPLESKDINLLNRLYKYDLPKDIRRSVDELHKYKEAPQMQSFMKPIDKANRLKGDSSHRLNVAYNPQRKDLLRMHDIVDNEEGLEDKDISLLNKLSKYDLPKDIEASVQELKAFNNHPKYKKALDYMSNKIDNGDTLNPTELSYLGSIKGIKSSEEISRKAGSLIDKATKKSSTPVKKTKAPSVLDGIPDEEETSLTKKPDNFEPPEIAKNRIKPVNLDDFNSPEPPKEEVKPKKSIFKKVSDGAYNTFKKALGLDDIGLDDLDINTDDEGDDTLNFDVGDIERSNSTFDYAKDAEETAKHDKHRVNLKNMSDKVSRGETLSKPELSYLSKLQDSSLPKDIQHGANSLLGDKIKNPGTSLSNIPGTKITEFDPDTLNQNISSNKGVDIPKNDRKPITSLSNPDTIDNNSKSNINRKQITPDAFKASDEDIEEYKNLLDKTSGLNNQENIRLNDLKGRINNHFIDNLKNSLDSNDPSMHKHYHDLHDLVDSGHAIDDFNLQKHMNSYERKFLTGEHKKKSADDLKSLFVDKDTITKANNIKSAVDKVSKNHPDHDEDTVLNNSQKYYFLTPEEKYALNPDNYEDHLDALDKVNSREVKTRVDRLTRLKNYANPLNITPSEKEHLDKVSEYIRNGATPSKEDVEKAKLTYLKTRNMRDIEAEKTYNDLSSSKGITKEHIDKFNELHDDINKGYHPTNLEKKVLSKFSKVLNRHGLAEKGLIDSSLEPNLKDNKYIEDDKHLTDEEKQHNTYEGFNKLLVKHRNSPDTLNDSEKGALDKMKEERKFRTKSHDDTLNSLHSKLSELPDTIEQNKENKHPFDVERFDELPIFSKMAKTVKNAIVPSRERKLSKIEKKYGEIEPIDIEELQFDDDGNEKLPVPQGKISKALDKVKSNVIKLGDDLKSSAGEKFKRFVDPDYAEAVDNTEEAKKKLADKVYYRQNSNIGKNLANLLVKSNFSGLDKLSRSNAAKTGKGASKFSPVVKAMGQPIDNLLDAGWSKAKTALGIDKTYTVIYKLPTEAKNPTLYKKHYGGTSYRMYVKAGSKKEARAIFSKLKPEAKIEGVEIMSKPNQQNESFILDEIDELNYLYEKL